MSHRSIGLLPQISAAHLVSHFHIMAIPALLPLLPDAFNVSFVELGIAISLFNIMSAIVQVPFGFAVDRYGPGNMLLAGLALGSASFLCLAVTPGYTSLLITMMLAGIANGVYHPANYTLLARGIAQERMGRAFSIHTFTGYLGGAMAPPVLLGIALYWNLATAFLVTALLGGLVILLLSAPTTGEDEWNNRSTTRLAIPDQHARFSLLAHSIPILTLLFILLSLNTSAIEKFSVSALVHGFSVPLSWASAGLTSFLFASALGVLIGGELADRTRHHALLAAGAFALAAMSIMLLILLPLTPLAVVVILGFAGFFTGIIPPSRDMLVRSFAPPGAEGKTFGIVMTGFNIGGAIGAPLFGWLLDQERYSAIFWFAIAFMILALIILTYMDRHAMKPPSTLARRAKI